MADEKQEIIVAFKGFDKNMQCRGYQYAIGQTYTHKGKVAACESGFHSCEYPLDVFDYYAPGESQYAIVEASGDIARHSDDSKIASSSLTVKASIDLPGIINAAIEYTMSRAKKTKGNHNEEISGAASNSGYSGAASNSGYSGAASNSGDSGAASNSGVSGAASNSGVRGAASNSGKHGVAADFSGYYSRAKSCASGAIVCINRDDEGAIRHIRASKVGENGIKADTWYTLDESGNFIEA